MRRWPLEEQQVLPWGMSREQPPLVRVLLRRELRPQGPHLQPERPQGAPVELRAPPWLRQLALLRPPVTTREQPVLGRAQERPPPVLRERAAAPDGARQARSQRLAQAPRQESWERAHLWPAALAPRELTAQPPPAVPTLGQRQPDEHGA